MTPPDPRVVTVVGHDASRTGAPTLLLSWLGWLADRDDVDASVVLLDGGELVEEYRVVARTTVLSPGAVRWARRLRGAAIGLEGRIGAVAGGVAASGERTAIRWMLRREPHRDLVVANTLASLPAATALAGRSGRLVCWVHELDHVADRVLPAGTARGDLLGRVEHFVAVGAPVAEMLVTRFAVPQDKISVVDAFVAESEAPLRAATAPSMLPSRVPASMRARPVVLAVGSMTRRKGPDRFIDLMADLVALPQRPIGVWLGGDERSEIGLEMRSDIEGAGLSGDVLVLPATSTQDVAAWMDAASVVVSTAREDPFPLALLEAAERGRPVVSFEAGGFNTLLVEAGVGQWSIGQGDLVGMAREIAVILGEVDVTGAAATLREHIERGHLVEHLAAEVLAAVLGVDTTSMAGGR